MADVRAPATRNACPARQARRFGVDPNWKRFTGRGVIAITGSGGFSRYAWKVRRP